MAEVIKVDDCGSNIGDYDIPIHNAIIIPEGATNGDMIKAMFPNEEMYEQTPTMTYYGMMRFDTKWWNAPYEEVEE